MNKLYWILAMATMIFSSCQTNDNYSSFSKEQIIVSTDITNFWKAYDAVSSTEDTIKQMYFLKSMFLENASKGQKKMMEVRGYTPEEYLKTIKERSEFWNSLRKNTENLEPFNDKLREGVDKLSAIYPDLKHSTIYYTIGNHRSPGTGVDSMILLGTEFALGDSTTNVLELPEYNQSYYDINPINHLSFLGVHEYVHTQQSPMVHNLLSLTLYEGIAEFVAIKATGQESPWKAFVYGPKNEKRIKQKFEEDMFMPNVISNWLWNSPNNEFQTRDLSYFVGYQIASKYYDASEDKKAALKKLIELDYSSESEVEDLVDSAQYLSKPLSELYQEFERNRPIVLGIKQFKNKSQDVSPDITEITLEFSKPLNGYNTGVDFGDLGRDAFPKGTLEKRYWSKGNKFWTMPVELEPNKRYQVLISNNFRTKEGIPLKPYLIEFKTK